MLQYIQVKHRQTPKFKKSVKNLTVINFFVAISFKLDISTSTVVVVGIVMWGVNCEIPFSSSPPLFHCWGGMQIKPPSPSPSPSKQGLMLLDRVEMGVKGEGEGDGISILLGDSPSYKKKKRKIISWGKKVFHIIGKTWRVWQISASDSRRAIYQARPC